MRRITLLVIIVALLLPVSISLGQGHRNWGHYRGQINRHRNQWQQPQRRQQTWQRTWNVPQQQIVPQQTYVPVEPQPVYEEPEPEEKPPTTPNAVLGEPERLSGYLFRNLVRDLQQIIQREYQTVENLTSTGVVDRQQLAEALRTAGYTEGDVERLNQAIDSAELDTIDRLMQRFRLGEEAKRALLIDATLFRLKQLVLSGGSLDEFQSLRFRFTNYMSRRNLFPEDIRGRLDAGLLAISNAAELLSVLTQKSGQTAEAAWPGGGKVQVLTLFTRQLKKGQVFALSDAYLVAGAGTDSPHSWTELATPQEAFSRSVAGIEARLAASENPLETDELAVNEIRIVNTTDRPISYQFEDESIVQPPNSSCRYAAPYQRYHAESGEYRLYGDIKYTLPGGKATKYRLYANTSFAFFCDDECEGTECKGAIKFASIKKFAFKLAIDNSLNGLPFNYRVNDEDRTVGAGQIAVWKSQQPLAVEFDQGGGSQDLLVRPPGVGKYRKDDKSVFNTYTYLVAQTGHDGWRLVDGSRRSSLKLPETPRLDVPPAQQSGRPTVHVAIERPGPQPAVAARPNPAHQPKPASRPEPARLPSRVEQLPDLYLLSIGVSRFRDQGIPDLPTAATDAIAFEEAWTAQEGLRFRNVHSRVLLNETATKRQIEKHLSWIETEATSKDLAVILFSSHGLRDSKNRYYLATHDMDVSQLKATCVSGLSINESVHELAASHSLVFFDGDHGRLTMRGVKSSAAPRDIVRRGRGTITFSLAGNEYLHQSGNTGLLVQSFIDVTRNRAQHDTNRDSLLELSELEAGFARRIRELSDGKRSTKVDKDETIEPNLVVFRFAP